MKRFASNYLIIPEVAYFKQCVVEIGEEGSVASIFPLKEEIHSVEWLPGVLVIADNDSLIHIDPFDFEKMSTVPSSEIRRISQPSQSPR